MVEAPIAGDRVAGGLAIWGFEPIAWKDDTPRPFQRASKLALILAPILYFLSFIAAGFYAFFLLIAANGVTSSQEPALLPWKVTMVSLVAYPVVVIICLIVAWLRYRGTSYRSAFVIALLPLLQIPISLILGVIALVSIANI